MPLRPLALLGLATLLAACSPSGGQEKGDPHGKGKAKGGPMAGMPPPEVQVLVVQAKSLPVVFEYTGQAAGSREAEVRARVGGILQKRNFDEGKPVKQGQSLYSIDPAPFQAVFARAEADVAAAEARNEQARRNAAR